MKCTVLTRDQVASHLQNYRPILFGKEEAPAKNTQPAATKKVERKKRATPEAPKDAPKKKQRVTLPQDVKQAVKISATESKPALVNVAKAVSPAPVKVTPPVQSPIKVPPPVETPVTPVKIDPFLSMPNEASDSLIEQFFGDFELIGVDFSSESPVNDGSGNDGSGNNGNHHAKSFTEPEASLFVDGRLGNFEIIEDGEESYPSPQSDCSFVCSSPPVVQASPAESSVDPFELDWNSPEFQLGEFEIEGVAPSSQEIKSNYVDEATNNFEPDHSCWYCDSYTSITSFI